MTPFAKLFETEKFGQILVVADTNDEGDPAVVVSVMPPGLGVCAVKLCYPDTDDGWAKRDDTFRAIDEAGACDIAAAAFKQSEGFAAGGAS